MNEQDRESGRWAGDVPCRREDETQERRAPRTGTRRDYQEQIQRVLRHLQRHMDEALSLDGLKALYRAICSQWRPASGCRVRDDPCFEKYLNSPDQTKPENRLTEIFMPAR